MPGKVELLRLLSLLRLLRHIERVLEILLEMVGLVGIGRPELFCARIVQIADGQNAVFMRPDGRSNHSTVWSD